MALAPGTKLGPYEIQSPLGAGGMGEVYRCRDSRLDRTVAIKILPSHLSDSPEAKQRFYREARVISSLSHPNICTLSFRRVATWTRQTERLGWHFIVKICWRSRSF
jgi:serine/threonine protein kinase